MIRAYSLCLLILFSWSPASARVWTSSSGSEIEADLIRVKENSIRLRNPDGQIIETALNNLSQADQAYLQEADSLVDAFSSQTASDLNALLGFQLFAERPLWQETAESIADRLSWRVASKTDYIASYQMKRRGGREDRGDRRSRREHEVQPDGTAHAAFFYSKGDAPDYFLVMFDNIGDIRSRPENKQEERRLSKELEARVSEAAEEVESKLSELLGEPSKQAFHNGRPAEHRMLRWDFGDVSFLLSHDEGYGLFLYIHRSDFADMNGQISFSSETLERTFAANVEARTNGDVVIDNIPMVHQGNNGFCVPATYERYLRYTGIPADMYMLSMLGDTAVGGGTGINKLRNRVALYIEQHGLRMRRLSSTLTIKRIAQHIDRGVPMIWTMSSSESFNEFANNYTRERSQNNGEFIPPEKETTTYPHMLLVTGYNEARLEIAISDSWGPKYEERWIPISIANQFDVDGLNIIDF
ncbi:MAG: SHD1 domain-containing protein [Opitutaceae bacterium]